jgi:hypothetical protein
MDVLEEKMEDATYGNKSKAENHKVKADILYEVTSFLDYYTPFTHFPNELTINVAVKFLKLLTKEYTAEQIQELLDKQEQLDNM